MSPNEQKLCFNLPDDAFLEPSWWSRYGLTNNRFRMLDTLFPRDPSCEEAATFFFLGNIDGWKQLRVTAQVTPRTSNSWNSWFFQIVRNGGTIAGNATPYPASRWEAIQAQGFPRFDSHRATLLFEFEIMNSAFNGRNGKAFKNLSFMNIAHRREWCQYDALLIVPDPDSQRGQLIAFEAKLLSELQKENKFYRHFSTSGPKGLKYTPSQLARNLEAGYWVTQDPESQYQPWEFHYVLVDSRYSLNSFTARLESELNGYFKTLEELLGEDPEQVCTDRLNSYDDFVHWTRKHITLFSWKQLKDALGTEFWKAYYDRIQGTPFENVIHKRFEEFCR